MGSKVSKPSEHIVNMYCWRYSVSKCHVLTHMSMWDKGPHGHVWVIYNVDMYHPHMFVTNHHHQCHSCFFPSLSIPQIPSSHCCIRHISLSLCNMALKENICCLELLVLSGFSVFILELVGHRQIGWLVVNSMIKYRHGIIF